VAESKRSEGSFKRTLLAGFFIILPLGVTLWMVQLVFDMVDRTVTPVILRFFDLIGLGVIGTAAWVKFFLPVLSLAIAVLVIWALGVIGGNVLGKQIVTALERLVQQIPVIRGIYSATRQFVDTFSSSDGRSFNRVVLLEWPRAGCWTLGLVTHDTQGEIRDRLGGQKLLSVYVPTTPNPTGGYLVFVPESSVIALTMSVDEALKTIISLGVLGNESTAGSAESAGTVGSAESAGTAGR
jgi:uncharacterized membrane protein